MNRWFTLNVGDANVERIADALQPCRDLLSVELDRGGESGRFPSDFSIFNM